MEKIFEIPGITYDPADAFRICDESEEKQAEYEALQEKEDAAIWYAWEKIISSPGFRACKFVQPGEYPTTYILHPSTRGYKWQLSRIAYDGIPIGHANYDESDLDSGLLLHDLREASYMGVKVRVIFDDIL